MGRWPSIIIHVKSIHFRDGRNPNQKTQKANNCIKERGSNVAYSCSLQMVEHKIGTSNMTMDNGIFLHFYPKKNIHSMYIFLP